MIKIILIRLRIISPFSLLLLYLCLLVYDMVQS